MRKQLFSECSQLSVRLPQPAFLPSPFFCVVKAKSFPQCWISELYLAVRLWISVLTVSENELFRFCLSLLSLCLRISAFLLSPSLPFFSAAFSSLLSFNALSLFLSPRVLTSVFHFFPTLQSSYAGVFLFTSFSLSSLPGSCPPLSSLLFQPWWNHLFCPLL